jgi:tetratricopeptide (TPR) repeat protein
MAWTINPPQEEVVFLMEAGFLLRDLQRYDEAREVFLGVRALAPASEVPEVALGLVAFQQRDFETAGRHYRRALQLNARSAWTHAHLGELALFQMNLEQAHTHFKSAIDLDPRGEHGRLARALTELADLITVE